jgi:integrase
MKIRFLLKRRGGRGALHPVYLALYGHDTTELIYTGQRISLKEWSKPEREPIDHSGEVCTAINDVKRNVEKVMKRMQFDELVITPFQLKQEYERQQKQKYSSQQADDQKEKNSLTSVTGLIKKWVDTALTEYLPSTRKTVIISINQFKEYLKVSGQLRLEKKDLTPEVIQDYAIEFLQKKRKLSDSTHSKRMKHLRLFLKWAKIDAEVIREMKIRTVAPSERNIISLTQGELESLEAIDVSYSEEMQKARDMFLLGCYTGLRVSDLKRINQNRIDNDRINLTLQKNRKEVSIPILKPTRTILQRYGMQAPKIAEQQVNESIKLVCEKAGIDKPTMFKVKKNGLLIEKTYPKHELITTHVAGKTFISLAPDRWGFTTADVAAFVGKDIKTILGYYMRPDQESAINKMIERENRNLMAVK